MTSKHRALWLVTVLSLTGCVAEPLDQSPLNTYPPLSAATGIASTTTSPTSPTTPTARTEVITLAKDQPMAGRFRYDVYAPADAESLPVVVLVHGLDGAQEIIPLARALAESSVLIVPQYESPARGGRFPDPLSVTTCALGLAADAAAYGGDPANVTVLGYEFGALTGFIVAGSGRLYLPPDCEHTEPVTARRLVAIGGSWSPDRLASDAFDAMTTFLGGTPSGAPATWALLDPDQYVEAATLDIVLLRGAHDLDADVTDTFAGDLLKEGWQVVVGIIPGHTSRGALTEAFATIRSYVDD